jgi:DnaK suppressor protein-like, N-terminal domain
MQADMNEHEEIAKSLEMRLSELRTHLAKVGQELHKLLPADSEEQAIELENQEALEVIEKTEATEIHLIEAALSEFPRAHMEPAPSAEDLSTQGA